jgi:hypothetical protein
MPGPAAALRGARLLQHTMRLAPFGGARARCAAARASSSGSGAAGGANPAAPAPPNIRELARMAQLDVTDAEVGRAGAAVGARPGARPGRRGVWPSAPARRRPAERVPRVRCPRPDQVADWEPKINSIVDWCGPPAGIWMGLDWTSGRVGRLGTPRTLVRAGCAHHARQPAACSIKPAPLSANAALLPFRARAARFGQLQAVDVEGVKAAVHARDEGSVLRADEPAEYADRWGV